MLIYLLQLSLRSFIAEHRVDWIWNRHGERFKLETLDGNFIDTMFIDKRESGKAGETLVIACEGNASCYEIGCAQSAAEVNIDVCNFQRSNFMKLDHRMSIVSSIKALMQIDSYAFRQVIPAWVGTIPVSGAARELLIQSPKCMLPMPLCNLPFKR